MIELTTPTKHKLADLGVLSQKNRKPDENPGAQLQLEALLPLELAELLFPGVVAAWYEEKPGTQGAIDGMAVAQLSALGQSVGWTSWKKTHSGHTLTIDFGMGGASNPVISGCTLSRMRVRPEEGAVLAKYMAESEDISEALFGKLAKLKSCEIMLTIEPPSPEAQRELEEKVTPAKARKPGAVERAAAANAVEGAADATAIFAAQPKDGDSSPPPQSAVVDPEDGDDTGSEGGDADATPHASTGKRTARGAAQTRKAIAEGLAAAGVTG